MIFNVHRENILHIVRKIFNELTPHNTECMLHPSTF